MDAATVVGAALFGATAAWLIQEWRLANNQRKFTMISQASSRKSLDLHDALLQGFLGVAWQVEAASARLTAQPEEAKAQIDQLLARLDVVLGEARQSIWDLQRNREQAPVDFQRLLEELLGGALAPHFMHFRLLVVGSNRPLRPEVAHSLMFILREAWWNARQHSGASNIVTTLVYDSNSFELIVEDDGNGLVPASANAKPGKWGIPSMHNRALKLNAKLELRAESGKGTRISIALHGSNAYSQESRKWDGSSIKGFLSRYLTRFTVA